MRRRAKGLLSPVVATAVTACSLAIPPGVTGGAGGPGADGGEDSSVAPSPEGAAPVGADGGSVVPPIGQDSATPAPTFVNTSVVSGNGNHLTIPPPPGVAPNDFMMASVYVDDSTVTVTPPSGWTTRKVLPNCYSMMYWAFAYVTTNPPPTPTFTFDKTGGTTGVIAAYRGVASAGAVDSDVAETFYNKSSYTLPSLTASVAPGLLIVLPINDEGAGATWTGSTNLQKRIDTGILGVFDAVQTTTGPTQSGQVTATGATPCGSVEVAVLRP